MPHDSGHSRSREGRGEEKLLEQKLVVRTDRFLKGLVLFFCVNSLRFGWPCRPSTDEIGRSLGARHV